MRKDAARPHVRRGEMNRLPSAHHLMRGRQQHVETPASPPPSQARIGIMDTP